MESVNSRQSKYRKLYVHSFCQSMWRSDYYYYYCNTEDDTDIQLWNEPHNLRRRNCSNIAQYFNERNKWNLESFGRRQPEFRYLYLYAECGPVCNGNNVHCNG